MNFSAAAFNPDKFSPFNIYSTSYKTVDEHPIGVDVLVPRDLKLGTEKHPLMVRFHGGYLVTGASLFPLYFVNWTLDLARLNGAIIVSADYRLLPEATGTDILADIADFWNWVRGDLQSFLSDRTGSATTAALQVDLDRILVTGDSAGGWLAVQSALRQPAGSIKALIGLYPQLDVRDPFFNTQFEKRFLGMPMLPMEIVDAHVKAMKPGAIVTTATPPARQELACSVVQNGRFGEFFGKSKELFPVEMVALADAMPAVLILHGREDSMVPVVGSERFVEALSKKLPEVPVRLDVRTGDHGFDGDVTVEDEWVKEDVDFITRYWLA